MARDRYERKHRRTAAHPECVAMMVGANFDAVPSLAEAMGLTEDDMRAVETLTRGDGVKIEYRRRADSGGGVLHLEHRELKSDGTPHDDRWYTVTDGHLLSMQRVEGGTAVIDRLVSEQLIGESPAAYAGLTLGQVAEIRGRGFAGKFPELTDAENNVIFRARVAGYGSCFPCYPTSEAQARNTLAGARKWLETRS